MIKKLASIALCLVLILGLGHVPAAAQNTQKTTNTALVEQKKQKLQQKYAIRIVTPTVTSSSGNEIAGIYSTTLDMLDTSLELLTPNMVRQISRYYQNKNGKPLTFSYSFLGEHTRLTEQESLLAGFDDKRSLIVINVPQKNGSCELSGDNPKTILHEMGHAFHIMCLGRMDQEQLQANWQNLCDGNGYHEDNLYHNYDAKVFVSAYAGTSYYEDFAETFAYGFLCNRPGLGLGSNLGTRENPSYLRDKLVYLQELIAAQIADSQDVQRNYARVYTAPRYVSYNGVRLGNIAMQMMGFPEPTIRANKTFNDLRINLEQVQWVQDLGCWLTPQGMLVYPNGQYSQLPR